MRQQKSTAWKRTSREKIYKNLGWESLNERRVMRKLCILYETIDTKFLTTSTKL